MSRLERELIRQLLLVSIMYGMLWGGFAVAVKQGILSGTIGGMAVVVSAIAGGLAGSILLAVFPRGEEFVFIRLGLAAICRTVLPLVMLIFIGYTVGFKSAITTYLLPTLLSYGVGIGVTVFSAVRIGDLSSSRAP